MMNIDNILLIKRGKVIEQRNLSKPIVSFELNASEELECFLIVFKSQTKIQVDLKEKGASCSIKVLYLAAQNEKIDIDIEVDHLAPETKSSQMIKGIATDQSMVSFHGNILIDHNAQKSDGFQNHRALLLSEEAVVQVIPALKIYADDVKCAHGSATGPLDEKAYFYLLSRGIPQKVAKKMLLESFVSDMILDEGCAVVQEWIQSHV